jgi:hypothetical protein
MLKPHRQYFELFVLDKSVLMAVGQLDNGHWMVDNFSLWIRNWRSRSSLRLAELYPNRRDYRAILVSLSGKSPEIFIVFDTHGRLAMVSPAAGRTVVVNSKSTL